MNFITLFLKHIIYIYIYILSIKCTQKEEDPTISEANWRKQILEYVGSYRTPE